MRRDDWLLACLTTQFNFRQTFQMSQPQESRCVLCEHGFGKTSLHDDQEDGPIPDGGSLGVLYLHPLPQASYNVSQLNEYMHTYTGSHHL